MTDRDNFFINIKHSTLADVTLDLLQTLNHYKDLYNEAMIKLEKMREQHVEAIELLNEFYKDKK